MHYSSRSKILGRVRDHAGTLWDVVESRPTEYDWPVLLGFSARSKPKGGPKVIPTRAIRNYLEQHRMNPGMVRLPISEGTILHLREQLGMNYLRDREQWWRLVKHELLHPELPPIPTLLDTDRLIPQDTWPKAELRRLVELTKEGEGAREIAGILGRPEQDVARLCRRFFGPRKQMHPWSDEDKTNLMRLKKEGHSTCEIATMMGRTLTSVQTQIFLLSPPERRQFRTWTQEEQQKLIELTKANHSVEEIMESMGRTKEAVIFMQRKIAGVRVKKLTPKTGREYLDWTEEEHQKLKELALAGHSNQEIAKIMGRTHVSITLRCRRVLGLKYDRKRGHYRLPDSGSDLG